MTRSWTALSAAIAIAALATTSATAFQLSQTFKPARLTFKETSMTASDAANRFCTTRGFGWASSYEVQSIRPSPGGGYWGHAVFGSVTCRSNPLPTTSGGLVLPTP